MSQRMMGYTVVERERMLRGLVRSDFWDSVEQDPKTQLHCLSATIVTPFEKK